MAKHCSNCGKELDDNAAICLNCGVIVEKIEKNNSNYINKTKKEKKKGFPVWAIILIVVGTVVFMSLIFILIGVFSFDIVDCAINYFDDYIEENVTQNGTIGDTLSTDKFNITLHESLIYSRIGTNENYLDIPDEGKEYLVFFFEVENVSDDNEYISYYDFTGYVDGYEVELAYLFKDVNVIKELNAKLPPKKKTKGYVAFEVDTSWDEFEIHYDDFFDSNELIFTVVNEDNSDIIGA